MKSEVGKISFKTVYLLETTTTNLADGKEDMIDAEPSMENELSADLARAYPSMGNLIKILSSKARNLKIQTCILNFNRYSGYNVLLLHSRN